MTKKITVEEYKSGCSFRAHVSEAKRTLDGLFLELVPRESEERLYYATEQVRILQLAIERLEAAKFEVGRFAEDSCKNKSTRR